MSNEEFTKTVEEQIKRCRDLLITKQDEYSNGDKLHNFRIGADLRQLNMREICAGYMAKHTVSIYDMCHSVRKFSLDKWNEKITDHINYLLLLRCIVEEEHSDES